MDFQQLVTIAPWTLILQICNLLLQIYLFKRFLLKPVQNILAQRQALANQDLEAAAAAREEAETAKVEYIQSLAGAKDEAAALVRTATQTAQTRSEQIILEAKEEAAAIRAKASSDIAQERRNAVNAIKNDISGIAVSIASKVVEKEIDEKEHEALIQDFIDQMGEAV
jgi:F-type H+-transporting ATPase subunit b